MCYHFIAMSEMRGLYDMTLDEIEEDLETYHRLKEVVG